MGLTQLLVIFLTLPLQHLVFSGMSVSEFLVLYSPRPPQISQLMGVSHRSAASWMGRHLLSGYIRVDAILILHALSILQCHRY